LQCEPEEDREDDFMVHLQNSARFTLEQIDKTLELLAVGHDVILLEPTFTIAINNFSHYVRPDLLICQENEWHVGEIKVYLDRGGETSGIEVASAVKQAAVGILATRETLKDKTFKNEKIVIAPYVDLVFRKHTRLLASVTRLNAEAELVTLTAGIRDAETLVQEWKDKIVSLDNAESLEQIPNFYTTKCENGCPYNMVCKEKKERDEGRVFHGHAGVATAEALGITGERAVQLAEGKNPVTPQEQQAARWLQAGWEANT
jgi:hypothetical protein